MSGHNKWQQIRHKKGVSDQHKGQIFSKLSKKIAILAREGTDPATNYRLYSAIEEARAFNMPKENIERAIKRAGEKEMAALNEVIIQAMGPGSIAIVIEAVTDNKNRTIGEIKNVLMKNEAKMVLEGSLNWMFDENWSAQNPSEINDPTVIKKLRKLLDELADHADVESVHSNLSNYENSWH